MSQWDVHQNLSEARKTARVALEGAIAELDNVAEDTHKDSTMFRQCSVSDLSLVQVIAQSGAWISSECVCEVCATDILPTPFLHTSTCCSHSC